MRPRKPHLEHVRLWFIARLWLAGLHDLDSSLGKPHLLHRLAAEVVEEAPVGARVLVVACVFGTALLPDKVRAACGW